jgi:hypothetical protein
MGLFFAPQAAGPASSNNFYEALVSNQSIPPQKPIVHGTGIADDLANPAITLQVQSSANTTSCVKGEHCIPVSSQGRVIFTVTPQVRAPLPGESISAEIQKTGLVMVELLIQEDGTGCSRTTAPAFKEDGFARVGSATLNEFNDMSKYFHYLQILGPNNPPVACTRAYSFLTSKDNSFQVQAVNQRSTREGFVSYAFFIRGHYDDKDLTKWPGSHHIFHLTTADIAPKLQPEIRVLDDSSSEINQNAVIEVNTTGKNIFIQNVGTTSLTLNDLSLPNDFELEGEFPTTVEAGSSKSFKIILSATKAGEYSGKVEFKTNDADESLVTFQVSGKVDSKVLTDGVFQTYQNCLNICGNCTDDTCRNNCKDDACGQQLLALVTPSSLEIDDFCNANPATEACIVKKVCSGKPEVCGIQGGNNTSPTIEQCKVTCKDDPFGCVGITDKALLDRRTAECSAMIASSNPTYRARKEGEENVSVLYLPIVDVENFLVTPEVETEELGICVGNISVAVDAAGNPDLSQSLFQVIKKIE